MLLPILTIALLASLASVRGSSVQMDLQMNAGCGFHLTTTGGYNGSVGQLGNGQVRAGSDLSPSLFTWFGDAFADQQGRGCWWTPPTSVLQCDWNQQPAHGFAIGCNGGVSYRDQTAFYECHTGDRDEVNLYLQPRGVDCLTVMIHADSCRPPCAGEGSSSHLPSPNPTPTPSQTPTSPTGQNPSDTGSPTTSSPTPKNTHPPGECDVVIAEGPDEIILIDRANPDIAYGPNPDMIVQLSPNASTIFVFRLSSSDAGKECGFIFDLPFPSQPLPYRLTGSGLVSFAVLDGPQLESGNTTWNGTPGVAMPLESVTLKPGMRIEPVSFPCPSADTEVAVLMTDGLESDACLEYEQLDSGTPMGLYLVKC
ncbi:uncharacterized protein GGS22DRAFT_73845 [Annulohypoxylon maeteangense]|uniref:uncharacterized protein n=1 Tax=Annulohypoxylon maeteangense TaxID=1927788 RepID=UPI0020072C55|nr:uncharacterized protein GGS22DRAFT_73845 [Annulohypoxylon maeteangense]KAI0881342.1 hypothetical protein GGS22DRAFT_73845 [Annulohypoxylon maeteangense]